MNALDPATLAQALGALPGDEDTRAARAAAIAAFAARGLPTPRSEDWKYTSLVQLGKAGLQPALPGGSPEPHDLGGTALADAVLARLHGGPDLVEATILVVRDGLPDGPVVVGTDGGHDALTSLNAAWNPGVLDIEIDDVVETPIVLAFVTSPGAAAHPRVNLRLGPDAKATVCELWIGPDGPSWSNAVVDVQLAEGATLTWSKLADDGPGGFHTAAVRVRQAANSRATLTSVAVGGAITRTAVEITLADGASCALSALAVGAGNHHDHQVLVEHAAPNATSRETFKGVVGANGRAVFTGKVLVRPGAQKTDAAQSFKGLLLDEDAWVNARPQLEIHADDVKAAHGVAIGALDPEQVFFLRARGLDLTEARHLLTWAFAGEVLAGLDGVWGEHVEARVRAAMSALDREVA